MTTRSRRLAVLLTLSLAGLAPGAFAAPLRIVTSVPDLASLAREVGGEEVEASALVAGPQDPHFVEARPSFVRELSRADLFARVGLDLESAWAPPLTRNARNTHILPGREGDFDASIGIQPLSVAAGPVDRSLGDVHPSGSPHFLLDPLNGLQVAERLADRLAQLRPERADLFRTRYADFERRLLVRLVGDAIVQELGASALAEAARAGRFETVLASVSSPLGGWLGAVAPFRGRPAVADHDLWPYFSQRFGIRVVAFLEPKPGVTPSTRHLSEIVERMQSEQIHVVLSAPYFHPRYAQKISEATGARILEMAHQVGAREGAVDYLETVDWNVRRLVDGF